MIDDVREKRIRRGLNDECCAKKYASSFKKMTDYIEYVEERYGNTR